VTDFLVLLNDPSIRLAVPVIRETLGWALDRVRKHRENAPKHLRDAADDNLKAFSDRLLDKLLERVNVDPSRQALIIENLQDPSGAAEAERAFDAATEISDHFTRESLADLVARAMTSRRDSAETIATKIATDASKYLSERQLRLLAFMMVVMGTRPDFTGTVSTSEEWTPIVIQWLRTFASRVIVDNPSHLDLAILEAAGVVTVVPNIVSYQLNAAYSFNTVVPDLTEFFQTDPLGVRIKASFDVVMRHRLNLAGRLLAVTAAGLITGFHTKMGEFISQEI